MALNLKKLNNNGNRGKGYTSTVMVEFKEVQVKDPKKATPSEDVLVAYLLHPVPGAPEYTTDKDGNATTEVLVKLRGRDNKRSDSDHAPLEIFDLPKKRGMHMPVKPGGIIALEKCYFDEKSKTLSTTWLNVTTRDPEAGIEVAHVGNLISVDRERTNTRDGETVASQTRLLPLVEHAKTFDSLADFKEKVASLLVEDSASGGGRPGVYVRLLNLDDPEDKATYSIALRWDRDNSRMMTAEESIDAWLADEENAETVENISAAGTEDGRGYLFEVIPYYRYTTGEKSLPSKTKNNRDDSVDFAVPVFGDDGKQVFSDAGKPVHRYGFALGTIAVRRMATDSDFWFATRSYRQDRFGPIFMRDELVTPNLPANVREYFEGLAKERGEQARASNEAAFKAKQEAEKTDDNLKDENIAFGEPDHSAGRGLTPR